MVAVGDALREAVQIEVALPELALTLRRQNKVVPVARSCAMKKMCRGCAAAAAIQR